MNAKLSNFLKTLLSVVLASALLWYSFKGVDWKDFCAEIRHCHWGYVLLSMLAGALAFAIRGLRWRRILHPLDPATRRLPCINCINISNVANLVIPYAGELVRCGIITRHSPIDPQTGRHRASYDRVLGTAILERGWDVLSVIILLIILLLFKWSEFGGFLVEHIFRPIAGSLRGTRGFIISFGAPCADRITGGQTSCLPLDTSPCRKRLKRRLCRIWLIVRCCRISCSSCCSS